MESDGTCLIVSVEQYIVIKQRKDYKVMSPPSIATGLHNSSLACTWARMVHVSGARVLQTA
jgi:hypothetical protein